MPIIDVDFVSSQVFGGEGILQVEREGPRRDAECRCRIRPLILPSPCTCFYVGLQQQVMHACSLLSFFLSDLVNGTKRRRRRSRDETEAN